MLNFRERQETIRREKLCTLTEYEIAITHILQQVLGYVESKPKESFEKGETIEILFAIDSQNRIYGNVYLCDQLDRTANFITSLPSKEEAHMTLMFLEQYFKNWGYRLLGETSVASDNCFSVIIKL